VRVWACSSSTTTQMEHEISFSIIILL
jgi:hypothetical protein